MPAHWVLFFILHSAITASVAQQPLSLAAVETPDTVVVEAYAGEPGTVPPSFRASWAHIDGGAPRFSFSRTSTAGQGGSVELTDLLIAAVDQYLDQRVHFTNARVETSLPVSRIGLGVERMVAMATAYFGTQPVRISEATQQQIARVCSIDWSQASFGVDGGEDQQKYMAIYYYVRAQRQELERSLRHDLAPLGHTQVPAGSAATHQQAAMEQGTLLDDADHDADYLRALDLGLHADSSDAAKDVRLTDAMLEEIASKATAAGPLVETGYRLRKRDRWLKAELDAIHRRIDESDQRKQLWELRDRMDDLEGRMDDIGLLVDALAREQDAGRHDENAVAGLSALTGQNLRITFGVGAYTLDAEARALLREVASAMARTPGMRVLVKGFADSSGDAALNLRLSERRAMAVRDFLLSLGIPDDQVLLNYYGASRSTGSSEADRRVELDWIR